MRKHSINRSKLASLHTRVSDQELRKIDAISNALGCPRSGVVRLLIRQAKSIDLRFEEDDQGNHRVTVSTGPSPCENSSIERGIGGKRPAATTVSMGNDAAGSDQSASPKAQKKANAFAENGRNDDDIYADLEDPNAEELQWFVPRFDDRVEDKK